MSQSANGLPSKATASPRSPISTRLDLRAIGLVLPVAHGGRNVLVRRIKIADGGRNLPLISETTVTGADLRDDSNNDEWGQSRAPIRTAMIWMTNGRCSLKAHRKQYSRDATQESRQRIGGRSRTRRTSRYRNVRVCTSHFKAGAPGVWDGRWAAGAASESKPRGQPSVIATIVYADTTSTWTTYEDPSPK